MKLRTRLVASFAYVLLVVIVALTVPLAIVMRDRARSELEALVRTNAQTIAAFLNQESLDDDPGDRRALTRDMRRYAEEVGEPGRRARRRAASCWRTRTARTWADLRDTRPSRGARVPSSRRSPPRSEGATRSRETSPWPPPPSSTRESWSGPCACPGTSRR